MSRWFPPRGWRRLLRPGRSYTLVELMVTVAILGILSGVVIDVGLREWRREQVNSVVVELGGWLQSVRRGALKGNSCTVTLMPRTYTAGETLAEVSVCGGISPLRIGGAGVSQRFVVDLLRAPGNRFTFTPAGTLAPPPGPEAPIVIRVSLAEHPDSGRCLQLEGLLGAIDVGVPRGEGCALGEGF